MATTIYERLYTYRELSNQSQLENFLTEALCDLLNRIKKYDSAKQIALLHNLFGYQGKNPLEFDTQRKIEIGNLTRKPDLVGAYDNIVQLVVEVKVSAPYQLNQLEDYGKWLLSINENNAYAMLAILTHKTSAPDDFLESEKYGVSARAVRYWQNVYDSLDAILEKSDAYHILVEEFRNFLKAKGLAVDAPTKKDFDKLCAYMQENTAYTIQQFLKSIRDKLQQTAWGIDLSWKTDKTFQDGGWFSHEAPALVEWVRVQSDPKNSHQIAWGFYFPPKSQEKDPYGFHEIFNIKRTAGIFLNILYAEAQNFSNTSPLNNHWYPPKGKDTIAPAVAFAPLEDFDGSEIYPWFHARFKEACEYLRLNKS